MDPRLGTRNGMTTANRAPGTALKPGQLRPGTMNKNDPNYQPVGMGANIQIFERPITTHGMVGISAKPIQSGRVFQDKSYFMGVIRQKISEIDGEIEKFQQQIDTFQTDNVLFVQLEKRFDELTKEVRNSEGTLADYNLAFDQLRAGARPEEIRNQYEHYKLQNDRLRSQLDEIFIERKQQEEEINAIEQQLQQLNQMAELKLNELDIEQKQEYESLIQENRQLMHDINNKRLELDEVNSKMSIAQNRLRMDSQKLKGHLLQEQIKELQNQKTDLEVQLNEANLSFPQARDRLLARIKDDNNFITSTDQRIKEIRKNIDNYEKQLRQLNDQLDNQKGREEEKKKFEILYQKDKEMMDFMDNFEDTRRKEMENLKRVEQNIVDILEQTSKILFNSGAMPSQAEFEELQGDIDYRVQQTDVSEQTLQKLQIEFNKRNQDVKQLEEAEERVISELARLNEKIAQMEDQMKNQFDKVNETQANFEDKKQQLIQQRDQLKNSKFQLSQDLKQVKYDHDLKEQKLNMHQMFTNYTESEQQLSQSENQLYNLRNFIITKRRDMNYEGIRDQCKEFIEDINQLVIQNSS